MVLIIFAGRGGEPPSPQCGAGRRTPPHLPAGRVPRRTIPDLNPSFSSVSPKWPTSDLVYIPKVGLLIVGTFHCLVRSLLTLPRHNYSRVWGGDLFNGVPLQTKCPHVHSSGLSQGCRPSLRASWGEKDARPPLRLPHYTPFLSLQNRSRPLSHHWHPV